MLLSIELATVTKIKSEIEITREMERTMAMVSGHSLDSSTRNIS